MTDDESILVKGAAAKPAAQAWHAEEVKAEGKAAVTGAGAPAPPAPEGASASAPDGTGDGELARLTDDIITALKTVYDPEIPADICLPSRRRRRTLEICHQEFIGTFSLPLVRLYSRRVNRR